MAPLAAGTEVGGCLIEEMVGRGGMGVVYRARLAAALQDAIQSIDRPGLGQFRQPQVPVAASCVRACDSELRGLAHALTDPHPRARGVVLARELLTDTTGPLYTDGHADQLRSRILTARSAL